MKTLRSTSRAFRLYPRRALFAAAFSLLAATGAAAPRAAAADLVVTGGQTYTLTSGT